MISFGSLFAGIGGLDLGLERAGMRCEWQVELDDYATRVLERHWPHVKRWGDVRTFPPEFNEWEVDLICGGFPCQDISYAGRGAGLGGERSGLFFEAVRVVRRLRPRYVLLENVAALLGRGLDRVLGELAAIGYDAEWHCIPAAAVGAPHIRDRLFILAYSRQKLRKTRGNHENRKETKWTTPPDNNKRCSEDRISKSEQCDLWAVEPDVGRVAHGVPNRVDRLECLGNAVVPQVAEYIGKQIINNF